MQDDDRRVGDETHFGYQRVRREDKARLVGEVFSNVAERYDLMNDLMSLGIHRLWKRATLARTGLRPGQRALDLAGGTGDLALRMSRQVGPSGEVVLADINAAMLARGRDRLIDRGVVDNVDYARVDAETLPFADNRFDCVTMAFGLRNVTDKQAALDEIHRVLAPGGRVLILEFSHPRHALMKKAYDAYSFTALPLMGRLVVDDADSYRYLAESIRMHPDQETLKGMMETAGLEACEYTDMTDGIVALHQGFKF